jgi:phosphatidylethanolamine/phosphatidyl-N-methylethanolamine N-methyltransferase
MEQTGATQPAGQARLVAGDGNFGSIRESAEFLRGFLRKPAQVGSVVPSSGRLKNRLVRSAAIRDARVVVELGPGTGGTTLALLQAMHPAARLLAIELDTDFHRYLQRSLHDPRLILEQGSAERIAEFLALHGLAAPDAIVSGIPFSTMPPDVAAAIAETASRLLRPGGRLVAYQVRAHVAEYVSPHLGPAHKAWEPVNVPPVRVFTWVKQPNSSAR